MSSLSGSIENLGGPFGAYLSDALFSVAGIGAYLILLILSFVAVRLLFFYQPSNRMHKTIKFISGIVLISSFSNQAHADINFYGKINVSLEDVDSKNVNETDFQIHLKFQVLRVNQIGC